MKSGVKISIIRKRMKRHERLCKIFIRNNIFLVLFCICFLYYFSFMRKVAHDGAEVVEDSVNAEFNEESDLDEEKDLEEIQSHQLMTKVFYNLREKFQMSPVGDLIFRNGEHPPIRNRQFTILIWKQGPFLEARHIYRFTEEWSDPFGNCSASNCKVTYEEKDLQNADAVIFLLQRLNGLKDLPDPRFERPSHQRWVFLTDECPKHTFITSSKDWKVFEGVFNWSMTYRLEADVPVPYGRTLPLSKFIFHKENLPFQSLFELLVPNAKIKRRDVLVAVLMSNCSPSNKRLTFVKELQTYVTVHIYGGCGTEFRNLCPKRGKGKDSRYGGACPELDRYAFYLSFENANCKEYLSEKPFWNGYRTGAVPVIMGPPKEDCHIQLPPKSYIHVEDFPTPESLAKQLLFLNSTWEENYLKFHYWRKYFEVRNEHGLFGAPSFHYCRLCEALNYNSEEPKVYNDLSYYLDPAKNC